MTYTGKRDVAFTPR